MDTRQGAVTMSIFYVTSLNTVDENPQHHLFPSKAKAWQWYKLQLREAHGALHRHYTEQVARYGEFTEEGDPRPKLYLDLGEIRSEADCLEPKFFDMPSSPTKAQIIETFNAW